MDSVGLIVTVHFSARSQTCVCAVNGLLFAIGGTDLWNTLNTVEVYQPEKDEWVIGSYLNITRRGAGVGIVDGKIHSNFCKS